MRISRTLIGAALLSQVACVPPVVVLLPEQPRPFEGVAEDDPVAMGQVARESRRPVKVEGPEALSKVIDALLKMGCTITASDTASRYVTFERIQKEPKEPRSHRGLGYDAAVTTGTLKLAPEAGGFTGTLVLTGRIHWRTVHHGIHPEVIPRLSAEDHKRFWDDLSAKL